MSGKEEAVFYVMDAREVVGNCALWWRPDSRGYTCDLDDAGLYTQSQVDRMRETDVPIHKDIVDGCSVRHARWDHLHQAGVDFKPSRPKDLTEQELREELAEAKSRIAELEAS